MQKKTPTFSFSKPFQQKSLNIVYKAPDTSLNASDDICNEIDSLLSDMENYGKEKDLTDRLANEQKLPNIKKNNFNDIVPLHEKINMSNLVKNCGKFSIMNHKIKNIEIFDQKKNHSIIKQQAEINDKKTILPNNGVQVETVVEDKTDIIILENKLGMNNDNNTMINKSQQEKNTGYTKNNFLEENKNMINEMKNEKTSMCPLKIPQRNYKVDFSKLKSNLLNCSMFENQLTKDDVVVKGGSRNIKEIYSLLSLVDGEFESLQKRNVETNQTIVNLEENLEHYKGLYRNSMERNSKLIKTTISKDSLLKQIQTIKEINEIYLAEFNKTIEVLLKERENDKIYTAKCKANIESLIYEKQKIVTNNICINRGMQSEIDELHVKVNQLTNNNISINNDLIILQKNNAKYILEVKERNQKLELKDAKIKTLEEDIKNLQSKIKNMQYELDKEIGKQDNKTEEINQILAVNSNLKHEIHKLEEHNLQAKTLASKFVESQITFKRIEDENYALNDEKCYLEDKIIEKQAQIKSYIQKNEDIKIKNKTLKINLAGYLYNVKSKIDLLTNSYNKLCEYKNADHYTKLKEYYQAAYKQELKKYKRETNDYNTKIHSLMIENKNLNKKLCKTSQSKRRINEPSDSDIWNVFN